MSMGLKIAGIITGLIFLGLVSAVWMGSAVWNKKTQELVSKLRQPGPAAASGTVDFAAIDRLPAPVARYFRLALKEGQPLIRSVRIKQIGEFNRSKTGEDWSPFEAVHYASVHPPGFVLDASIKMAPLLGVKVRDFYFGGLSAMKGKIGSVFTVMDASSSEKLSSSALQRYLAEAVWYPTALLPGENMRWTELDDRSALASLTDSGLTVSLVFHFNEAGEVSGISTQGRYFEEEGKFRLEPWGGRHRDYQEKTA